MIDVVVGQDHPSELRGLETLLDDELKYRPVAARVTGIDDRETIAALNQICLRAPDARDSLDHMRIIGFPVGRGPARAGGASHVQVNPR